MKNTDKNKEEALQSLNIKEIESKLEETEFKENLIQPLSVKYCEICRFPEEYCNEAHAVIFKKENKKIEETKKDENVLLKEGQNDSNNIKDTKDLTLNKGDVDKDGKVAVTEEGKAEIAKDGKDKKKKVKEERIVIECSKRGKKKHTTYVSNVEKFGLNIKDVAKLFSKKFACSSTVTKEVNNTECITLTGEFGYDIVEFLTQKFPNIKEENCKVIEEKPKQ